MDKDRANPRGHGVGLRWPKVDVQHNHRYTDAVSVEEELSVNLGFNSVMCKSVKGTKGSD